MFTANKDVAYSDTQLRVAFDGDAVLFSDESEQIVKEQGLDKFFEHEQLNENKPLAQVCTFWINDFSEHFFWFKFLLYFSSFPFLCVPFIVEAELLFRCPIYFLFQGLSLKCMFDSRETITTILSADQSLQRKKNYIYETVACSCILIIIIVKTKDCYWFALIFLYHTVYRMLSSDTGIFRLWKQGNMYGYALVELWSLSKDHKYFKISLK